MPLQATVYKILIASPSDVKEERKVIPEVISSWNAVNSDHYGIRLEPVLWETHATPEMGKRPQAIINKQLVENCDILVAIFWTRLGTHTGEAESGTVEEIKEFQKAGKPVLLYFSSIDIPPENIDLDYLDQYKKLLEFKKRCEKEGLVTSYKSIDDLRMKLQMHITQKINSIHKASIKVPGESDAGEKILIGTRSLKTAVAPNEIITKTIKPRVYDERKQPPIGSAQLPSYIWDAQNFEGFFYDLKDDLGKESLQVLQPNLGANQRTISKDKLIYSTTAEPKKLKVVEEAFGNNVADAVAAGLDRTGLGQAFQDGNYYIIGWQAEKYVALNGKVDKLAKLLIEQGTAASEKKTLTVGETWDMGRGWTLSVQAIDARATPRQTWLVLAKDGVKKDDKVVSEKRIYTYVEKSIAGETDVPLFVTYVDSVFAGATTDMVQLRYTWLTSGTVTTLKGGDKFGVFEVVTIDSTSRVLQLSNTDTTVSLSQNATVDLMSNLKFKVADRADVLRFYPIVLR